MLYVRKSRSLSIEEFWMNMMRRGTDKSNPGNIEDVYRQCAWSIRCFKEIGMPTSQLRPWIRPRCVWSRQYQQVHETDMKVSRRSQRSSSAGGRDNFIGSPCDCISSRPLTLHPTQHQTWARKSCRGDPVRKCLEDDTCQYTMPGRKRLRRIDVFDWNNLAGRI